MTISIIAKYEDGVLKPDQPLPFKEHELVQVLIQPVGEPIGEPSDEAERIVRRSKGLLGWNGDVEVLRRLAEDPEFDPQESA